MATAIWIPVWEVLMHCFGRLGGLKPPLRMKSYFASSVQKAMEDARNELGDDAVLVSSRLAPAEAGQPRRYEVVFATGVTEKAGKTNTPDTKKPPAESPGAVTSSIQTVLSEIREMRQQLELLSQNRGPFNADPATRQLLAQLSAADVDPDLAQQLLAAAAKRVAQNQSGTDTGRRFFEVLKSATDRELKSAIYLEQLRAATAAEIRDFFRADTGFQDEADTTTAALIGPPGAGKTATIAKIAIRYGLKLRRPVLLISADNQRVAASEQLRGYASILGLRFELAQSSRALGQLLDENRAYGLILIDTAGFSTHELSSSDVNDGKEILRFLAGRNDIRKHLVLPASMRGVDVNKLFSAWESFAPSHLIFSRMDETTACGPMLNEAMVSGLPVSFFAAGQRIPEDLEEASAEALIQRLLPASESERRIAAAA